MTIRDITKSDVIQPLLRLSNHVDLGHLTTGVPVGPRVIGPLVKGRLPDPNDPRILKLANDNVRFLASHWKIARNLQHMSQTIIDPLVDKFGDDLRVYMSYANPMNLAQIPDIKSPFFTGEAISLFLNSNRGNMFLQAQDILDTIKGQFTSAQLMFNQMSWLKISTQGPLGFLKNGSFTNPLVSTFDLVTGRLGAGLMPLRGTFENPFRQLPFFPYESMFNKAGKFGDLKKLGQFPELGKFPDQLKQITGMLNNGDVTKKVFGEINESFENYVGEFQKIAGGNVSLPVPLDDAPKEIKKVFGELFNWRSYG